jgi:hypothetical protein
MMVQKNLLLNNINIKIKIVMINKIYLFNILNHSFLVLFYILWRYDELNLLIFPFLSRFNNFCL